MAQSNQQLLDLTYPTIPSHGHTLVANFIHANPHWALTTLYIYCLNNYSLYLTPDEKMKDVFASSIRDYINSIPS